MKIEKKSLTGAMIISPEAFFVHLFILSASSGYEEVANKCQMPIECLPVDGGSLIARICIFITLTLRRRLINEEADLERRHFEKTLKTAMVGDLLC